MRVSYNILQDYFEDKLPVPKEIADKLTFHAFEIESVEEVGGHFNNVVVGKVLKKEKHPNADRLNVCVVDVGDGGRSIVCGASNVAEGQTVAVALPGALLPGDFAIKVSKIRGVESNGMICSEKELGFTKESPSAPVGAVQGQEKGIWVLPPRQIGIEKEVQVGTPLKDFLGIETDYIFDIKVLPDRAHDCLSHLGIAREIGAICNVPLKKQNDSFVMPSGSDLHVVIEEISLSKRYAGIIIRDVKVSRSPDWLQNRLRVLGQKPINNIVDITNYVMQNSGQPLHAFDLAKIKDKKGVYSIAVRQAKKDEKLVALDDIHYTLPEDSILITDGNSGEILGVAGIKGGKASAITEHTQDILIEAGNFNPVLTRLASQNLKLRTESSLRFEKDISPELVSTGLSQALKLIQELAQGTAVSGIDLYPQKEIVKEIEVTLEDISNILGISIPKESVKHILESLDCAVSFLENSFVVIPPLLRLDLNLKEDIIKEIGRIYGYENIQARELPKFTHTSTIVNKLFYYTSKITRILAREGFSEIRTYSFKDKGEVEVLNPLALDKKFLRTNLADGMLESFKQNIYNAPLLDLEAIKVFEVGTVFNENSEHISLCIGIKNLAKKAKDSESLKKITALLEKEVGLTHLKEVGGVLECNLEKAILELPEPKVYEFNPSAQKIIYKPISNYPFILRDIAVLVSEDVEDKTVATCIRKSAGNLLVRQTPFDVFKKDGKVSYAFRLVFQSQEKTLSDDEINKVMEKITGEVHKNGWVVR